MIIRLALWPFHWAFNFKHLDLILLHCQFYVSRGVAWSIIRINSPATHGLLASLHEVAALSCNPAAITRFPAEQDLPAVRSLLCHVVATPSLQDLRPAALKVYVTKVSSTYFKYEATSAMIWMPLARQTRWNGWSPFISKPRKEWGRCLAFRRHRAKSHCTFCSWWDSIKFEGTKNNNTRVHKRDKRNERLCYMVYPPYWRDKRYKWVLCIVYPDVRHKRKKWDC
jgi:hypothetical protein